MVEAYAPTFSAEKRMSQKTWGERINEIMNDYEWIGRFGIEGKNQDVAIKM
ncbi:MAG: hypothetical protein Q8903_11740 [Bacteroidota bacterium]|nr:hypothetical protein [Bacteroidota bacterium]